MVLLLTIYVAGALVTLGMVTARFGRERILVLHPRWVPPLFVAFWPVAWLFGVGATVMVAVALLGVELEHRGHSR